MPETEPIEYPLEAEEDDKSTRDKKRDPRILQAAGLTSGDKQAGERDHAEERDHHHKIARLVDEQEARPIGARAVRPVFQPEKGKKNSPDRQQETGGVVTRRRAASGDVEAEDRQCAEHDKLGPKDDPDPIGLVGVLRWQRGIHSASQIRRRRIISEARLRPTIP